MTKRIYISSDYSENDGDRNVVDEMKSFCKDSRYSLEFVDMAEVASGSVSKDPDCRACDLKKEFNRQINASSIAVFIVGDKTATRTAGSSCERAKKKWYECYCTPYKQNANGTKQCKVYSTPSVKEEDDVRCTNSYSYLKHEFKQAVERKKKIVIFYNAEYKMTSWLPEYMKGYENFAYAFWIKDHSGKRVCNYELLKRELM